MLKLRFQYFCHVMWKTDSLEKTLMLGKIEGRRKKEKQRMRMKMVGWHHRLNGHEFEQTPGESKRQGSLACCSSWGHKELDMTEWLNSRTQLKPLGQKNNFTLDCMHVCMLSCFSCVWIFVTLCTACPWDSPGRNIGVACHALLQGDLPDPGIKFISPVAPALQADSLMLSHQGSPCWIITHSKK